MSLCVCVCIRVSHVCLSVISVSYLSVPCLRYVRVTDPAQVSPVQQVTEAFCAVPLDDALSAALLAELEQEGGQLVTRVVHAAKPPVQNINSCDRQTRQTVKKKANKCILLICSSPHHKKTGQLCAPP